MSKYVITITQDPAVKSGSQTTVRVDLSSGQPRVQELLVRSGDDRGLASADLPPIDLGMLIRALSGAGAAAAIEGIASSTSDSTSAEPATTRRSARGGAKKKAAAPRSRARAVTRDSKSRSRRAASDGAAERAYRRMPDPDEVLSVYQQTGTITGLAQHFGVPRHTAQGWAGRLRRNGYQIGRH